MHQKLLFLPTPQERAFLRLIVRGLSDIQAAALLQVPESEAQAARERLQARVGVSDRRALIARALIYRWL